MHSRFLIYLITLTLALLAPGLAYPEEKVITVETSYIMGDGETPAFSEAMVLQKAKQTALEEAGTYVQSHTKSNNLDITIEEIQTITGGLLKTEVLSKTRTLVGNGVRFDIAIKATVRVEKMEGLARRIRNDDIAQQYRKLQDEYARLNRELTELKQSISVLQQAADRQLALNRLQGLDRSYRALGETEAALMQRLVSGGNTAFHRLGAAYEQGERKACH